MVIGGELVLAWNSTADSVTVTTMKKVPITFHLISIFPEIFDSYFHESILKRAQAAGQLKIVTYNVRDFTNDKHRKTDDKPYGGGPGMIFYAEPILRAVETIKSKVKKSVRSKSTNKQIKIIFTSPGGKQFDNPTAISWSKKYTDFIVICGRYEGIDARVKKILKAEEVSIGPYTLTGGELPAMVMIDAITRQIPGVLGNEASPEEKRISSGEMYTRPEVLSWDGKKYRVPKVLLSGNHRKIDEWKEGRKKLGKKQ